MNTQCDSQTTKQLTTWPNAITEPGLNEWSVITGWRGSVAHGMFVPSSDPNSIDDKDVMAVCIPPIGYYYGLKEYGSRGTKEIKQGEWDIVVYEFRKFISLLIKGNPNVMAMLWLDNDKFLKLTSVGKLLVESRNLFVGKHVYHSYIGYAHGQLHRMTHMEFNGYMGEKRKKLVEKYGYDTKNAAHLIRLLRMGIEFLRVGKMWVDRSLIDSIELLSIKRGEWSLERVQKEANELFELARKAKDESPLPEGPNLDEIQELVVSLVTLQHNDLKLFEDES